MRILNFGSMNLDHVYQVKDFVRPGETDAALSYEIFPGGKGLNQSIAIAKAGGAVFHAGAAGEGGSVLERCMQDAGVDCTLMKHAAVSQGHAIIQVNRQGENCIILHPGSNHAVDTGYIDETLDGFSGDTYLVLQNEINNLTYLIERAWEKGLQIVLNPSPMDEAMRALDYGKVSWLLVNEIEGALITGKQESEEILEALYQRYPTTNIVLTLGSKGSVCRCGDTLHRQSSFSVEAMDTTGAGDTFTGYLIAGIAEGKAVTEALQFASAASAISVTRTGAATSIPMRAEVEEFLLSN